MRGVLVGSTRPQQVEGRRTSKMMMARLMWGHISLGEWVKALRVVWRLDVGDGDAAGYSMKLITQTGRTNGRFFGKVDALFVVRFDRPLLPSCG
jgi:hypothetical protein